MTKRSVLDFAKRLAISEELKTICHKPPGKEYAEYVSPWTDVKFAEKWGVTPGNIAGIRKAAVGDLRPAPGATQLNEVIKNFNEAVGNLADANTALRAKIHAIEERLSRIEHHLQSKGGFYIPKH